MKKTVYVSLFILIGFFSCKKRDNANYSYWYVNNDSFATNDVKVDVGKGISFLYTRNNIQNYFYFKFYASGSGGLSTNTPLLLSCIGDPFHACLSMGYKSKEYQSLNNNSLVDVTNADGKVRLTLKPTWFVNVADNRDTVLISGIFNEP